VRLQAPNTKSSLFKLVLYNFKVDTPNLATGHALNIINRDKKAIRKFIGARLKFAQMNATHLQAERQMPVSALNAFTASAIAIRISVIFIPQSFF